MSIIGENDAIHQPTSDCDGASRIFFCPHWTCSVRDSFYLSPLPLPWPLKRKTSSHLISRLSFIFPRKSSSLSEQGKGRRTPTCYLHLKVLSIDQVFIFIPKRFSNLLSAIPQWSALAELHKSNAFSSFTILSLSRFSVRINASRDSDMKKKIRMKKKKEKSFDILGFFFKADRRMISTLFSYSWHTEFMKDSSVLLMETPTI